MALDTAVYLVTREIAIRSGVMEHRYRIADGRFVLDNKDLSRVRFTTDEYVSGLSGVEKVSQSEAERLIKRNGYQRGGYVQTSTRNVANVVQETNVEETTTTTDNVENATEENTTTTEESNEESVTTTTTDDVVEEETTPTTDDTENVSQESEEVESTTTQSEEEQQVEQE